MIGEHLSPAQLDRILYRACLAPSPHNVQGWKFEYRDRELRVLANADQRIMAELDPQEKEGSIALGAAIANLGLAAAAEGFAAELQWLPDGADDAAAASISFSPIESLSPQERDLYRCIETRGINRSTYLPRPIPAEQLTTLQAIAAQEGFELHVATAPEKIKAYARLAGEAGRFKFSHASTHRELFHYLRFSAREAAASGDGLPLEHFNIPARLAPLAKPFMDWRVFRLLNIFGCHHVLAYLQESHLVNSAAAICMLRSPAGDRLSYLQGGRALQRVWLTAARYGLAVQPHSAVADLSYARLGGYHPSISTAWQKRIDHFPDRLGEIFSHRGELHVINIFRVGYPSKQWKTRSLRRPMEEQVQVIKSDTSDPAADAFYQELTRRNAPFISAEDQKLLRRRRIGVAGCGSIGGASLEVLARMGAENLLLAEPDIFELNNLNRQNGTVDDIGKHKAETILQRMRKINPAVHGHVLEKGLTPDNLPYFVGTSAVIIDGVDVTEPSALKIKIMLHEEACRQQKTVICGYDIAGTQLLRIYDYRSGKLKPLHGKFSKVDLDFLSPLGFLSKVVSPLDLPFEMLPVIAAMIAGRRESIPQLGPTASLFGVLSAWAVLDVLAGRPLRHKIRVDIPDLLRPRTSGWRILLLRLVGIVKLKLQLERAMRVTKRPLAGNV